MLYMKKREWWTEQIFGINTLLVTQKTRKKLLNLLLLSSISSVFYGRSFQHAWADWTLRLLLSLQQKFCRDNLKFLYNDLYIIKNGICGSSMASWQWKSRCFVDIWRSGWSLNLKFSLGETTYWLPIATPRAFQQGKGAMGAVFWKKLGCSDEVIWTLVPCLVEPLLALS